MENSCSNKNYNDRKRGQHLKAEERGAIKQLKRLGYSNRSIAKLINCNPPTVGYELRRETKKYTGKGRKKKVNLPYLQQQNG